MGDNLFPTSTIFSPYSPVMIAFDPKVKIPSSDLHFIICCFVVIEFFQVSNVPSNFTAEN